MLGLTARTRVMQEFVMVKITPAEIQACGVAMRLEQAEEDYALCLLEIEREKQHAHDRRSETGGLPEVPDSGNSGT